MPVRIRRAEPGDAAAIAAVYNLGVAERTATFQPEPLPDADFLRRIESGGLFLIAGDDDHGCLGAAWVSDYDPLHRYYRGVGETTVFVDPGSRRKGVGRALLEALRDEASAEGRHKLVAKIFAGNEASLSLFRSCGFRQVGTHLRHGSIDGEWKDVVVVERALG